MEPGGPKQEAGHSAAKTFVGGAIAFYAVFDTLTLGVATTALVIFVFNPLIVFVGAAIGISLLNYACCMWVDRERRSLRLLRTAISWSSYRSDLVPMAP